MFVLLLLVNKAVYIGKSNIEHLCSSANGSQTLAYLEYLRKGAGVVEDEVASAEPFLLTDT